MLLLHLLEDASSLQEAYQVLTEPLSQSSHAAGTYTQKLTLVGEGRRLMSSAHCQFTGGKQKASRSWAQGSGNTSSRACPADVQGSSMALLWGRLMSSAASESGADYPASEQRRSHCPPRQKPREAMTLTLLSSCFL